MTNATATHFALILELLLGAAVFSAAGLPGALDSLASLALSAQGATVATIRYPNRGTVAMYLGCLGSSPSWRLSDATA